MVYDMFIVCNDEPSNWHRTSAYHEIPDQYQLHLYTPLFLDRSR